MAWSGVSRAGLAQREKDFCSLLVFFFHLGRVLRVLVGVGLELRFKALREYLRSVNSSVFRGSITMGEWYDGGWLVPQLSTELMK